MNTTKIDLHCHSNASDGKYSPAEIINRAYKNNVKILALTDHDTINGLNSALEEAKNKEEKYSYQELNCLHSIIMKVSMCLDTSKMTVIKTVNLFHF